MKTIDSLVQSSLDGKNFGGVILAKLHFNPILRYNSSYQTVYWDESGGGDQAYLGLGHLANVSVLTETNELAAQTIQLSISGIPNSAITDVFSDEYIGKPCYLWYATLDPTTYAIEGGQNGPILMFAGRMDFGTIEFGETTTITINVTNRLADWERARGGRFNQGYQQRKVDPNDQGFRYVQGIQNKPLTWGAITISDPGPPDPGDQDGGGGGGVPGGDPCFIGDTNITMSDGYYKSIQDIKIGDMVMTTEGKPGKVIDLHSHSYTGKLIGLNYREPFATTAHPFMNAAGVWTAYDVTASQKMVPNIEISSLEIGTLLKTSIGNVVIDYISEEEVTDTIVYNITVDTGTYIANGFYVHNK